MSKARTVIFGLLLSGAVAGAVATVVAQPRPQPEPREQEERRRLPFMMLEGRGAQIGVSVDDLSEEQMKTTPGAQSGVIIREVDQNSAASKAGLREGDIVVDVDGERVRSAMQFSRLIRETPGGRTVKLGIVRDGKRQSVDVVPQSREFGFGPDGALAQRWERSLREFEPRLRELEPRLRELEPRLRELEPRFREFHFDPPTNFDFEWIPRMTSPRGRLGVQLNELTPQLAEYFGVKDGGVLVSSVTKDSPAEKAGLKAGDVITSIDGDRVRSADDVVDELRDKEGEISVGVLRDKKESTLKATIEGEATRRPTRRPA
jgi:membrane-associated protease RseP (regulator of RpoE activity)